MVFISKPQDFVSPIVLVALTTYFVGYISMTESLKNASIGTASFG